MFTYDIIATYDRQAMTLLGYLQVCSLNLKLNGSEQSAVLLKKDYLLTFPTKSVPNLPQAKRGKCEHLRQSEHAGRHVRVKGVVPVVALCVLLPIIQWSYAI